VISNEKPQVQATVLVVEDESLLLMVVSETLRDAGYAVWEAGDGESALRIIKAEPEIDLLITDVRMPGMNGYQLVDAGLALRPELKVMLMTGYAQDPIPRKLSQAGIQVLHKPFDFDKLPDFANRTLERD